MKAYDDSTVTAINGQGANDRHAKTRL